LLYLLLLPVEFASALKILMKLLLLTTLGLRTPKLSLKVKSA